MRLAPAILSSRPKHSSLFSFRQKYSGAKRSAFPSIRAFVVFLWLVASLAAGAQGKWRPANEAELRAIIPARAPAISERIETEFRTASGITDGKGHFVAGVVMITAGYSAEGKYSHYFLTQLPLQIGDFALAPGDYLFGWTRVANTQGETLKVNFYQASSGKPVGEVDAHRDLSTARVESFRIWAPGDKSVIQIGRFTFPYRLSAR
jgi:hypothetical protein